MLTDIICSQFNTPQCTPLGYTISQSCIFEASENIFQDKQRSIIELVLNSVDAYRALQGEPSIGKFGMGFYSVLEYIRNRGYIIINSHTLDEHWECKLTRVSGNIQVEVNDISPDKQGTSITIYGEGLPTNIHIYEKYLSYISGIQIIYEQNLHTQYIAYSPSAPEIHIIVEHTYTTIKDNATGISKQVLYESMLVPGTSTKGIHIQPMSYEVGLLTDISATKGNSVLDILVGEIPILNTEFKSPYIVDAKISIQMPSQTLLPVSRDNILSTQANKEAFNVQVKYILSRIHKDIPVYIYIFQRLIEQLPDWMAEVLDDYIKHLPDQNIYYIPNTHMEVFQELYNYVSVKLIPVYDKHIPVEHFVALESYLLQSHLPWDNKVFQGKSLLILPNLNISFTSAGFGRLLFTNQAITNPQKYILAYPEDGLQPYESTLEAEDMYKQLIWQNMQGLSVYYDVLGLETFHPSQNEMPLEILSTFYAELSTYIKLLILRARQITGYTTHQNKFSLLTATKDVPALITTFEGVPMSEFKSPKFIDYYKRLIAAQFAYFKQNISMEFVSIWSHEYLPPTKNSLPILDMATDIYEYIALINFCVGHAYDGQSDDILPYIPALSRYWFTKLNTQNNRNLIISSIFTMDTYFNNAYESLSMLNYDQYTLDKGLLYTEYKLSDMLYAAFQPDINVYAIPPATHKSQLITIAVNRVINNPVQYVLNAMINTFPKGEYNLYRYSDGIVILVKYNLTHSDLVNMSLPYTSKFLEIYKVASLVHIQTSNYLLEDQPIYADQLVIDIHRKVYHSQGGGYVAVHIPSAHPEDTLLEASQLITLVYPMFNEISYAGRKYTYDKQLLPETSQGWILKNRNIFDPTIEEHQSSSDPYEKINSWIFYNGLPVSELNMYTDFQILKKDNIRNYINTELLINFNRGDNIQKIYTDIAYYKLLQTIITVKNAGFYLYNIDSSGEPQQLRMAEYPIYDYVYQFVCSYSPFGVSLSKIINDIIGHKASSYDEVILYLQDKPYPDLVKDVVKKWFRPKFIQRVITTVGYIDYTRITFNIQLFISVYWVIAQKFNIPELRKHQQPPAIHFEDLHELGHYNLQTHKIVLNKNKDYSMFNQPNWVELIQGNNHLIGNIFPPQTLIHELYHSLLGNQHASGSHGSTILTIHGNQEEYTFNTGAMKIYQESIVYGLVNILLVYQNKPL